MARAAVIVTRRALFALGVAVVDVTVGPDTSIIALTFELIASIAMVSMMPGGGLKIDHPALGRGVPGPKIMIPTPNFLPT
jgi:hypothetical protein